MAKVLIVDDYPSNRELIATLIGYDGHQALEAGNGAEALALVRSERPELVICDIVMPVMDGYEFVRQVRADPAVAATEVIFYTANYDAREIETLTALLGVSTVLVKPCSPEEIIAAVDRALAQAPSPAPVIESAAFEHEHQRILTEKLASKVRELELANQRLTALTELNLQLSAMHDPHALLDKVCQGARALTCARYAILCIQVKGNGRAVYFRGCGLSAEETGRLESPVIERGVFGRVMAERKPIRFLNPGGRPERIGLPAEFPLMHCGVAAPIASTLSIFGWVCLLEKVGASEFSEEDEWLSRAHAAQAGNIYENRNLYALLERRAGELAEEIQARERTEHQLQRVMRARMVMAECSRTLVRATEERALLADLCRFLVDVGQYAVAWVALARHDPEKTLETVASAGDSDNVLSTVPLSWGDNPHGRGPAGLAVRTCLPQVENDIRANPTLARWHALARARGLNAAAALPLMRDGDALGVLCIVAGKAEAFDPDEIDLLLELADDIAYGIRTLRARVLQFKTEEMLRLRDRAIEESINAIAISAADRAADNPIIYANRAFSLMSGYGNGEVVGRNPRFLLGDDWQQPGIERLREAVREGSDARVLLRNYRRDGSLIWNEISLASVHDGAGKISHFISVFNDLTDHKRYEAELEQQANHDALTGLANRNLLNDRLKQAIARAHRAGSMLAVMLIDLDRFKLINDSLGHADGDALLQEVARRLNLNVRQDDTVARLGGDEFMIVMSEIGVENDAATLARKLLEEVTRPVRLSDREMVVTASLGISLYPRDGEVLATLLKNADVAMYRAKEVGRNGFQFYAPEMNARALERLELENALRSALINDELQLHYQPKVSLASGRIVGAEALIRWQRPGRGMVPPADFIPLAEETGLIVPIGEWVIRSACRQIRHWQDEGLPDVSVAVNVSARQFAREKLVPVLTHALDHAAIAAVQLQLELTESAVMSSPDETLSTLRALKQIGVLISLDDFGTGYSSLDYLKRFPIDSLKIDQSFVRDLATSSEDAAIAQMVIALAHSLGHKVIAEGVETKAQLDFLHRHGCDEMQGYLFSRPLPADDFARLLRDDVRLTPAQTDRGANPTG